VRRALAAEVPVREDVASPCNIRNSLGHIGDHQDGRGGRGGRGDPARLLSDVTSIYRQPLANALTTLSARLTGIGRIAGGAGHQRARTAGWTRWNVQQPSRRRRVAWRSTLGRCR